MKVYMKVELFIVILLVLSISNSYISFLKLVWKEAGNSYAKIQSSISFSNGDEANLCTKVRAISDMGKILVRMTRCTEVEILVLVLNILW